MKRLCGLTIVAALAGCTTTPPSPPVLSYAGTNCGAAPDLTSALPLAAGKKEGEAVLTPLTATAPCVEMNGFRSPYVVYRVPDAANRMVDVGGVVEQLRVFPPAVATLGVDGTTIRKFEPTRFQNRGGRYSVQFIPQDDERYILVTVDPRAVGTSYQEVTTGVSTTYLGLGGATWMSGVDETVKRSRSYEGVVVATVFDTTPKPS
jgi:hypothetical protein